MTLIKQLWVAIGVVAVLAFGGSLVISMLSARHYLEQELLVRNVDSATALALSLTQLPKDAVTIELQINAQFDTGHYRRIRLVAPDGRALIERARDTAHFAAPRWFADLFPIQAPPGLAQVQDGWLQFGTLSVEGDVGFAHATLWRGTLRLLAWFIAGGLLTGLVGSVLLSRIIEPLSRIVTQAEALGDRRFLTTPEPSTAEFRAVVRAMNRLTERMRSMLIDEAARLEDLRRLHQHDELTGLLNRTQFMNVLDTALTRDDLPESGSLWLLRVGNLTQLNQASGRARVDRLLTEIGAQLRTYAANHANWETARLNGSDFALLAPAQGANTTLADALLGPLHELVDTWAPEALIELRAGAGTYRRGTARNQVLATADRALALAEQGGPHAIHLLADDTAPSKHTELSDWRRVLSAALEGGCLRLDTYPVMSIGGRTIHLEALARLHLDDGWQSAGYFIPWATRTNLVTRIDEQVVEHALRLIASGAPSLCINLSPESLHDTGFRQRLFDRLHSHPRESAVLSIEIPEIGVIRWPAEFRAMGLSLRPLGCRMGIEHVGSAFSRIPSMHELGVDYLKVDASLIRGIDANPGNQSFVRGLAMLAHTIGLQVYAEGVASADERRCIEEIGCDGFTGPVIARS